MFFLPRCVQRGELAAGERGVEPTAQLRRTDLAEVPFAHLPVSADQDGKRQRSAGVAERAVQFAAAWGGQRAVGRKVATTAMT